MPVTRRKRPRKTGRLSNEEKKLVLQLQAVRPEMSPGQIAKTLNRRALAIQTLLHDAKLTLQEHAPYFADLMVKGAAIAAAKGDTGPAQWVIERLSNKSLDGTVTRVLEPLERPGDRNAGSVGSGLTVNVGINLSQVQPTDSPQIEVIQQADPPACLPIEHEPIDLSPLLSED